MMGGRGLRIFDLPPILPQFDYTSNLSEEAQETDLNNKSWNFGGMPIQGRHTHT